MAAQPSTWPLVAGAALLFAALLMLALVVLRRSPRRARTAASLDPYRVGARPAAAPATPDQPTRLAPLRPLLRLSERLLDDRDRRTRVRTALDLAGIPLRPAEWLLVRAVVSLVAAALFATIGSVPAGIGGLAFGWFGTRWYLRRRTARRRAAFADQLPDMLQLIAGALEAGFSLPQALAAVVREGARPAADELALALARTRLGMLVDDALDSVAERMASTDFRWVAMAIRIQREVGGNLAELLRTTVHTMRERAHLRRHVKALTAEGRLSAYVLIALPVLLTLWMWVSRRSYLEPLYTTGIGWVLIVMAVGAVSAGWFWMSRLTKVEV